MNSNYFTPISQSNNQFVQATRYRTHSAPTKSRHAPKSTDRKEDLRTFMSRAMKGKLLF